MALLFIDGFEGYGPTGNIVGLMGIRGWIGTTQWIYPFAGRLSGYGIYYDSGVWSCQTPILTSTPSANTNPTFIVGWAQYKLNGTISIYHYTTLGISVIVTGSSIEVKLGTTSLSIYNTTILDAVWYYIETKVYCHTTEGTVEVRLNGTTVISLNSINTQTGSEAFYNTVKFTMSMNAGLDDIYVCNGSGTSCNDFLGVCKILPLLPCSDTGTVQWTPSAGTEHYVLVDENPASTTDYVSSNTQGQIDLYGYPSLASPRTILGVQVNTTALLSLGTSIILESPIISNGVYDLGEDFQLISSGALDQRHISTTDPSTNEPWTVANLAAAQIGVRVV
jgi:hypothetical protein